MGFGLPNSCVLAARQAERLAQTMAGTSGGMMEQQQKTIKEWDVVQEAIDRNTQPRICWKRVFGDTLTKTVAGQYAEGKTSQEAYGFLVDWLKQRNLAHPELLRRLLIGVCARYGEIKSESRRIAEVRNNAK